MINCEVSVVGLVGNVFWERMAEVRFVGLIGKPRTKELGLVLGEVLSDKVRLR